MILTFNLFLFIYGCVGSSFLREGFLQLWQAGATLHRGARASHYRGLYFLRSTGSRRAGSVVVAHGPSCSAACGILPDQGSNPCPLHQQADSQPLRHQGSPKDLVLIVLPLLLLSLRTTQVSIFHIIISFLSNYFIIVFLCQISSTLFLKSKGNIKFEFLNLLD